MDKYRSKGAHKNSREVCQSRKKEGGGSGEGSRGYENKTGLPIALDLGRT